MKLSRLAMCRRIGARTGCAKSLGQAIRFSRCFSNRMLTALGVLSPRRCAQCRWPKRGRRGRVFPPTARIHGRTARRLRPATALSCLALVSGYLTLRPSHGTPLAAVKARPGVDALGRAALSSRWHSIEKNGRRVSQCAKTPKHRLMPIRAVSRCNWLTQNVCETSLGSAK